MGRVKKEIKTNISIHNRFDIEVRDAVTGEIKQRAQAFNVVCDGMYITICSRQGYGVSTAYGSGTGTPSASDTALFHQEGTATRSILSITNDGAGLVTVRGSSVLGVSDAVGKTITEVGLMGTSRLTTHAMLQDMNGNPISITKTDTDIITIYSTVYVHYSGANIKFLSSRVLVFVFSSGQYGTIYSSFAGLLAGTNSGNYYGTRTPFFPLWTCILMSNPDTSTYIHTDNYNNWTFDGTKISYTIRVGVGSGNLTGGIEKITMITNMSGQTIENPAYNENEFEICALSGYSIQGESVGTGDGTTTAFKTKFSMPYNATVYINGVQAQAQVKKETVVNNNNIIFATPPAQGDVITIDYTTDYIPKDSDHVLDMTLTIQFGEYQPT